MESKYDCVLLDLDGTLTDSLPGITQALAETIVYLGYPRPDEATMRSFVGPPLEHTFRNTLGFSEAETLRAIEVYRKDFDIGARGNPLFPGVRSLLVNLSAQLPLALATSKPRRLAGTILKNHGVYNLFSVVEGGEPSEKDSTKAAVVGRALKKLREKFPAQKPVMVGDRCYDQEGAAENGVPTILVTWGYAAEAELEKARRLATSPAELKTLLLGH